jgi:hypothetical protein
MNDMTPLLGAVLCCIVPLGWSVAMIALGIWYERNGFPYEIRRRERHGDD